MSEGSTGSDHGSLDPRGVHRQADALGLDAVRLPRVAALWASSAACLFLSATTRGNGRLPGLAEEARPVDQLRHVGAIDDHPLGSHRAGVELEGDGLGHGSVWVCGPWGAEDAGTDGDHSRESLRAGSQGRNFRRRCT